MKKECKVNMKQLTSIVDDMLAERNKVGRQAFDVMTEDHMDTPAGQNQVEGIVDEILGIVQRNGFGEDAKGQLMELIDSILDDQLNEEGCDQERDARAMGYRNAAEAKADNWGREPEDETDEEYGLRMMRQNARERGRRW